jgi:hypothetical protein
MLMSPKKHCHVAEFLKVLERRSELGEYLQVHIPLTTMDGTNWEDLKCIQPG